MATTVQNVIDGIAWQTDLQSGTGKRLDPATLIPEIDAAYKEAWELIVAAYEDFFVKKISPDITVTGGVGLNTYQIVATDFFKLRAVQRLNGSVYGPPLPVWPMNEKGIVDEVSYRLLDDTLHFEPELSCAGTYRIWYIYVPADLTLVGDTLVDRANGAVKRFCIETVVTRVVLREEEDSSAFERIRAALVARISKMASHRNVGKGRRIADTRQGRRFRNLTKSGYALD